MTETVNPVAELREAARLMRERAAATVAGHWTARTDLRSGSYRDEADRPRTERVIGRECGVAICGTRADAEHIASWHPIPALAVAGLLELEATIEESIGRLRELIPPEPGEGSGLAPLNEAIRAVARAYLDGETR